MKTIHKQFALVYTILVFLMFNGCYTTFHAVRQDDSFSSEIPSGVYSDEDYYSYDSEYGQYDEDQPETVSSELHFLPSRLVVEKTYYDYGEYVREIRYVNYDPYPWMDPYYYDYYPNFHVNFTIQAGSYGWHRPWVYAFVPPVFSPAWYPIVVISDPWCYYPVYYPVYCPVYYPVYYPVPVYPYGSYYSHVDKKPYKKRDWDKRQPKEGPRIGRRPSGGVNQGGNGSGNSQGQIARRPGREPIKTNDRLIPAEREREDSGRKVEIQKPDRTNSNTSPTIDRKSIPQKKQQVDDIRRPTQEKKSPSSEVIRKGSTLSTKVHIKRPVQQKFSSPPINKPVINPRSTVNSAKNTTRQSIPKPAVKKSVPSREINFSPPVKSPGNTSRAANTGNSSRITDTRKPAPPVNRAPSVKQVTRAPEKTVQTSSRQSQGQSKQSKQDAGQSTSRNKRK